MVVSSDELVTSQYINGFKMATLASISANDTNTSIHQLNNFNLRTPQLKLIRSFLMLKKHIDSPGSEHHQEGGDHSSAQLN